MSSIRFIAIRQGLLLAPALLASAAWAVQPSQQAPSSQASQASPPTGRAALEAMTVADLETAISASPGAVTFEAAKRYYPGEYRALLETIVARIKASDGSFSAGHLIGAEVMRAFMVRRGPELINAPAALLNRINARQLELVRGLSTDQVALCAEYATTGFTGRTPLPEPHRSRTGALGALLIEASRAGADRPREAGRGTLSQADAMAWFEAVQRIGTPQDVIDAMSGAESAPPSQDLSCRMGIAVYAAIDALPAEQAARVGAYFLHEGLRSQAQQ